MISQVLKSVPGWAWTLILGWLFSSVMWLASIEGRINNNAKEVAALQSRVNAIDHTALEARVDVLEKRVDIIVDKLVPRR